jgi:hypothetical protein
MNRTHQTFAVGRLSKNDRRLIVVDRTAPAPPPIRGPWELRAVFGK